MNDAGRHLRRDPFHKPWKDRTLFERAIMVCAKLCNGVVAIILVSLGIALLYAIAQLIALVIPVFISRDIPHPLWIGIGIVAFTVFACAVASLEEGINL